ncbi:MAG: carbonic anhydrase [Candidatus Heimdallarchaeaceae archaeon]
MKEFATAINCIDGRVQIPVIDHLKNNYKIDYVDIITVPGANKILAENKDNIKEAIKKYLNISINVHKSKIVAIVGHYDCAGNPSDKETQLKDIHVAMKTVASWGLDVHIIGLWVDKNWKSSLVK